MFAPIRVARFFSSLRILTILCVFLLLKNPAAAQTRPVTFDVSLMDGSWFRGETATSELSIELPGETRSLPIHEVKQLVPGLNRRPELLRDFQKLVQDFGSADFRRRESAVLRMRKIGPEIGGELRSFQQDSDLERRYRVRGLLKEFGRDTSATEWSVPDSIETAHGTIKGRVTEDAISFDTEYGRLQIPWENLSSMRQSNTPRRINLLKQIDVKTQAIRGDWVFSDGILQSPADQPWALLQLETKPPSAYTIQATIERKSGRDALVFPVVVGKSECNVCIDGWPRGETLHTGLEMIRGEGPLTNGTSTKGTYLPLNQPVSIQIDVTPTSVRLAVDQKKVFHWKGDPAVFSMQDGWKRRDASVLALGSYNASFKVSSLALVYSTIRPPTLRASAGDYVIELKDGMRFVLRPGDGQTIEILHRGVSQTIPLKRLRSLVRRDASAGLMEVELTNEVSLVGTMASDFLSFEIALGTLKLPCREIVRISRVL